MPSTKISMSMGLLLIIANYLAEGKYIEKIKLIKHNRILQVILLFELVILLGLIWSWDVFEGLKDIKSRISVLAIPLIIGTRPPLTKKQLRLIINIFLASLVFTSIINFLNYNGVFGERDYNDIRGLSLFASHVRYSILISLGFGISIVLQFENRKLNVLYTLLTCWFMFYTIFSQILTGNFSLILVGISIIFYYLWFWKKLIAILFSISILLLALYLSLQFATPDLEKVDCEKLPKYTELGNPYTNMCDIYSEINGRQVLTNYSNVELNMVWQERSKMDFFGKDKSGEPISMTTARYMTSLNLSKDAKGFKQLSDEDIQNIENGYTYRAEKHQILMPRIYSVKYQIINNKYPNGHSLLQRIEHWKASIYIIKRNFLFGYGTGGNYKAMQIGYDGIDSPLYPENRVLSHNMYFSYLISNGLIGLIAFLSLLFTVIYYAIKTKSLISFIFIIVLSGSFFIEDTLDTQLGVTIFSFFVGLLVNHVRLKLGDSKLSSPE